MITQRELVSQKVSEELTERGSQFGLILDDISIVSNIILIFYVVFIANNPDSRNTVTQQHCHAHRKCPPTPHPTLQQCSIFTEVCFYCFVLNFLSCFKNLCKFMEKS